MKNIALRPARKADMEIIEQLHREQNERDGTNYPLNLIFDRFGRLTDRNPVALVGEIGGAIESALYVEKTAELLFAGCNPSVTAFARRDIEAMKQVLLWQGFRQLQCMVPRGPLLETISKPLVAAGFENTENRFAHFFLDLEGKK